MARLGLERSVVDAAVYQRTVAGFAESGGLPPTIGMLASPATTPRRCGPG
jgi:hypothetical protein